MLRVLHNEIPKEGHLILSPEESHHLVRVRRAQIGRELEVLDGRGARALAKLRQADARKASLEIQAVEYEAAPKWTTELWQAIPKGKLMDGIVQKATELGVSRIRPIFTDQGDIPLDEPRAEQKRQKWCTIADEAIKQCGNPWRPMIDSPASLKSLLEDDEEAESCTSLVAALTSKTVSIEDALQSATASPSQRIRLAIGPEGDFSPTEYALLENNGWAFITLGPLVLRVETASCALLSIVLHLLRRDVGT
jgi:16S rRNA (uracil1498-N3)-methyltransferase